MNKLITVVMARPEDAEEIRNIQRDAWFKTYPNKELGITSEDIQLENFEDPERVRRWQRSIETKDNSNIWVAKEGTHVIGFCMATSRDGLHDLRALYVHPNYQGRGVGRQLMTKALEWLGDEKDISVYVASYNSQAIGFYKKNGFIKTNIVAPSHKLNSGKEIPEILMIRRGK